MCFYYQYIVKIYVLFKESYSYRTKENINSINTDSRSNLKKVSVLRKE